MKKLNIRAILIVMLVLVLAFALVACGEKEETPTPGGSNNGGNSGNNGGTTTGDTTNVKNYFNTLWDKTGGIGDEAVGKDEDLALSLDLSLALSTIDNGGNTHQNIDLGIALDAILDRSNKAKENSDNTSFKIRLYDPSNNETWVTVYYFLGDADYIYLDFAGKNIKVPFAFERGELNNEAFSHYLWNMLYNDKITGQTGMFSSLNDKSIGDVIEYFTGDLGEGWTLNTLVGGVTKLFNLDLKGLLFPENTASGGMDLSSILGMLGLTKDNMFDANGNLNLKNILTNDTVASFFKNGETTVTATHAHTVLDTSIFSMLSSILGDFKEIINDKTIIELDYDINGDSIDGFDIGVTLGSISAKVDNKNVNPKITIGINDLSLGKAPKAGLAMAAEKSVYSTEIAVNAEVGLNLTGIAVDLTKFDKQNADGGTYTRFSDLAKVSGFEGINNLHLDGDLKIGVNGKVDLATRNDKGETNNTALSAWLSYNNVNVVELSFVNDTVAFKVNHEAKVDNIGIIDLLVRCWGDVGYNAIEGLFKDAEGKQLVAEFASKFFTDETHLVANTSFNGGVWTNINIAKNANDLINGLIDKIANGGNADAAPTAEEAKKLDVKALINTIKTILPAISTDGNLEINVGANGNKTFTSVGNAVEKVGKLWDKNMSQKNFVQTIIDWDKSGMLPVAMSAIKLDGAKYTNATEFLNALFASTAGIELDLSADNGVSFGIDIDVNSTCGIALTINFNAQNLGTIEDLGADVTKDSAGWFYYEF